MKDKSGFFQIVVFLVGLMFFFAIIATFCGCANRGCKVTVSSASVTSLGDINWDEYKIPVFSIFTGPRLVVWINPKFGSRGFRYCRIANEPVAFPVTDFVRSET